MACETFEKRISSLKDDFSKEINSKDKLSS